MPTMLYSKGEQNETSLQMFLTYFMCVILGEKINSMAYTNAIKSSNSENSLYKV